MIFHDTDTL